MKNHQGDQDDKKPEAQAAASPADLPVKSTDAKSCCGRGCSQGMGCTGQAAAASSGASKPLFALMCERIQKNTPMAMFLALFLAVALIGSYWEALMP